MSSAAVLSDEHDESSRIRNAKRLRPFSSEKNNNELLYQECCDGISVTLKRRFLSCHSESTSSPTGESKSNLSSLDLDSLRSVLYYIYDHQLFKLYVTGSKLLIRKMQDVVEELVLGHGVVEQYKSNKPWTINKWLERQSPVLNHKWPLFWLFFRRLKCLSFLSDAPLSISLFKSLPSSLHSLSIQSRSKYPIWNDLMISCNALHNLQSLSYEHLDSYIPLPYDMDPRLHLPSSIKQSLHCLKIPSMTFSYCTSDLPPNLITFEGAGIFVDFTCENPMFGDPKAPYKQSWVSPDEIADRVFPPSLSSIDFSFSSDFSLNIEESFFHALPATLLRLNLRTLRYNMFIRICSSIVSKPILPNDLQYLGLGNLVTGDMNFSHLPQKLQHWYCQYQPWNYVLKSDRVLTLPPTLKTMCFKDGFRSDRWGSKVDYSKSPLLQIHNVAWCCMGNTEHLFNCVPMRSVFSWWSPSNLPFSAIKLRQFKSNWSTNNTSDVASLVQNQFLPNCSKLDICLTDLTPDGKSITAFTTILPQYLKKLRINVLHMRGSLDPSISLLFTILPKSLTKLVFKAMRLNHVKSISYLSLFVPDLASHLPNLTSLQMFAKMENVENVRIPDTMVKVYATIPFRPISMPPLLEELKLSGFVVKLQPFLKLLPATMQTCKIDCFISDCKISLPPSSFTQILPSTVGSASRAGLNFGIRIVDLSVFLDLNIGISLANVVRQIRNDNNHLRCLQVTSIDDCDTNRILQKSNDADSSVTPLAVPNPPMTVMVRKSYYKRREQEMNV